MATPFEILKITNKLDDQLIKLLTSNVIGTPGQSMLYQHVNVPQKVRSIPDPVFCNLSIRNRLYGTITFCKRVVYNLGKQYPAYYLRYFTFSDQFRSNHQKNRRGSRSIIREEVSMLMNGHGLDHQDDAILYAYVDPENIRSKRLIEEFGFKNVGSFHTIPFSRLIPRANPNMSKLNESELQSFTEELKDFYSDHQLVSFDNLNEKGDYFVLKQGSEIICGVQGILDSWEILDLPGPSGRFMMNILPYIPLINRLFNSNYKFVFLEGIYCKLGHEHRLKELLGSVLKFFKVYSGILCIDPKSGIYDIIQRLNLGLTHKIMGEKEIEIFAKSNGPWKKRDNDPFFISGYDVL